MITKALTIDFDYLTQHGFSEEQARTLIRLVDSQSVTLKDIELLKKDLKLWVFGVILTVFTLFSGYFSWLITHLDNKTRIYVDERFNAIDERFNAIDERFNKIDERFNRIETDIKTLLLIMSPSQKNLLDLNSKKQENK